MDPAVPWDSPASARRYRLEHSCSPLPPAEMLAAGALVPAPAGAVVLAAGVVAAEVVAEGAVTVTVEPAAQPVARATIASADPASMTRLTPGDELFNRASLRT